MATARESGPAKPRVASRVRAMAAKATAGRGRTRANMATGLWLGSGCHEGTHHAHVSSPERRACEESERRWRSRRERTASTSSGMAKARPCKAAPPARRVEGRPRRVGSAPKGSRRNFAWRALWRRYITEGRSHAYGQDRRACALHRQRGSPRRLILPGRVDRWHDRCRVLRRQRRRISDSSSVEG
jgi:hypothetical protein